MLNFDELLETLQQLGPAAIFAYGYWGKPSATAVTPYDRLCFAVFAVRRASRSNAERLCLDLDLPKELLAGSKWVAKTKAQDLFEGFAGMSAQVARLQETARCVGDLVSLMRLT